MSLNQIFSKLLSVKDKIPGTSAELTLDEITFLCSKSREIFISQPVLLELQPPLTICGDIHGQYHDLLALFETCKYPPQTNYLFLGDYVDRGRQSIETICLLLAFKIRYPENFFLLRGNHECSYINSEFGFYQECIQYYDANVWKMFCDVFNCLPITAIVDEKIFCVHGGISQELNDIDQLRKISRPTEVPEEGLLCDLLWSDPYPDLDSPNGWAPNERGAGYFFAQEPVEEFLDRFHFDLVARAHQAVMSGFDFPYKNQGLVTIFSAPNYCYQFNNKGAMMQVDEKLFCSFVVMKPKIWEKDYFIGTRPGTPPHRTKDSSISQFQLP